MISSVTSTASVLSRTAVPLARASIRRNLATSFSASQTAADPIQQLFVDKVREYAKKKSTAGGKLVDATPQVEAELKRELDKIAAQFGGSAGAEMTKFPDFKFAEPKIEDIDVK